MPFLTSTAHHDSEEQLSRSNSHVSHGPTTSSKRRAKKWWKVRLFRGMVNDIRRRAPYYWSDWRDAWDYRVVPATVYMYFAKYAPRYVTIDRDIIRNAFSGSSLHSVSREQVFQFDAGT